MKKALIIFLLSLTFGFVINASEKYYFRHYTNKDGLSHNTVFCSLQDKKGFMWFGTDDGLNRFDGYLFQIFRHNKNNTDGGLLSNNILSLYEDSSGKIWICTQKGVCYYDYETDSFHPFAFDTQSSPYLAEQIYEDINGYLWFRNHFNIVRYDIENKSAKVFNHNENGFRSVTMTMTEGKMPVFADSRYLFVYNSNMEKFDRLVGMDDHIRSDLTAISALREVPQVGFLIGTDQEGLFLYHSGFGIVENIIPGIQVRSIMQYNPNMYWIASESGIYIYNLIDKSVVNLKKSLTNEYTIADNAVYSLTKDREGGIWVTSFFGGINYLSKNHANFNYYIGGKTHPGMLGNTVREICPDKYGNLWLGTEDNGINRFDLQTGKMENYSLQNPDRKLAATNIHGLYAEGDTLWIGSFNKGIELLHIPTGKIIKSYNFSNTNGRLVSNFVLCFYKTKKDEFLIGTSNGVVVYDKKNDTFSPWKRTERLVRQILEDTEGHIWVATNDGLYKYTPPYTNADGVSIDEKISLYREMPSRSQGLGSSNTTSVFEDSKGRVWVTTAFGFSLYNRLSDSFNQITTDDGLPSNMIYRIVEDDDNLFWVSTANGLVHFNPETHVMHTYTYSDGLHEMQFNFSSSYKASNGIIYMGTVDGMISFNPKNFVKDVYIPQLYITHVRAHDNPEESRFLLKYTSAEPYTLRLPYNSSTFTVSYIAPIYTSTDAVKYSYLLEGIDKDWIFMDNNKDVTFANLSPGEYTFKVRSTNSSDVWQDNEQSLNIVITPPFWKTTAAYLAYFFIVVLCLILFYRYKKRVFIKRARHNQELFEVEKEKELYNAKIQFFTFITHEIRTPLTLIKAPLEKIMRSGDGDEATKQNLGIIEKNTQQLLDLSNQLLDFRKTESRGFRLNFVKTNVTILMENILMPFIPAFQNENKKLIINLHEKHVFAYIDRNAFTKIVSNMITNAFKYSVDYVAVEMVFPDEMKGEFRIVVMNDGYLIPEKERENIFKPFYRLKETEHMQGSGIGLSLSRTLAEFHNGSIGYGETHNGLNRFTLTLPVKQEGYNFDLSEKPEFDQKEIILIADSGKPVVLVVEDQQDMRRFLTEELSSQYEILEAENGREAMNVLTEKKVDLIISDVMMPFMDGFELCNAIKNDVQFSHLPFVLLTAQHNLQSRLIGLNKGADAYLEKPFSLEYILAQVENLLKNREILRKAYLEKPQIPASSLAVSPVDNKFIQQLNEYIEENLTNENLSVEVIAEKMNMSNSSLYRKVKSISDLSPVDFIRMARLKKSVQLMHSGEKRISEIAFLVGFSSPAYFSTSFQKQYGKSPSEFMKEIN